MGHRLAWRFHYGIDGLAFTLCYATAGIFVARLVDHSNGARLIAVCVAIWAISTTMCGTAHNFEELLFWRAGTAIAEVALSPAALSIISDMFSARKVTRATSAFMLGPSVGGGIALFGGGSLLSWTENPSTQGWLSNAGLQPWQLAFFVVGLPGLLLALVVALTLREPTRRGKGQQNAADTPPTSAVLRELMVTHRFEVPYFIAYVALILLFYTHAAWFPTLLIRKFGLHASNVGKTLGPVYMLGGIAVVSCAGLVAGRFRDEDALKKVLQVAACAAALLVPAAFAVALVPSPGVAIVLYGVCAFAASIVMALAHVPIQIALPNRMRGRAIALLVFLTNTVSGGLGPFSVGSITESMGDKNGGLSMALALVGTSAAVLSALMYWTAARRVSSVSTGAKWPHRL